MCNTKNKNNTNIKSVYNKNYQDFTFSNTQNQHTTGTSPFTCYDVEDIRMNMVHS